jgi:hypothetical protein
MKTIEILIAEEILKSTIALHEFGKPVNNYISREFANVEQPTLLIINLLGVTLMDYEFVNIAFKELILNFKKNPNLYISFRIKKWEFEELCTGLIDILGLTNETNEISTLINNFFSLIYVDEKNNVNYIHSLLENEKNVLMVIENNSKILSTKIQQKLKLIPEEIATILDKLISCKLIFKEDNNKYTSIKSLL